MPGTNPGTPVHEHQTFNNDFECWLREQNEYLRLLNSAADEAASAATCNNTEALRELVSRVMDHYASYYEIKARWEKQNVLAMCKASGMSTLEGAFQWIAGWRPTTSIHLLYSKSGLQIEAHLPEFHRGAAMPAGDLSDLSSDQLNRINNLQRRTIEEEKEISEKMATHQESIADVQMVELAHHTPRSGIGISISNNTENVDVHDLVLTERLKSALEDKEKGLLELLLRADDLRMRTLRGIIDILNPIQAVHFLITTTELHLGVHNWGRVIDEHRENMAMVPN